MATLTVEGVPAGILARLAAAAASNGRCLNSELILLLARTFPASVPEPAQRRCPRVAALPPQGCRCRAVIGWGGPAS